MQDLKHNDMMEQVASFLSSNVSETYSSITSGRNVLQLSIRDRDSHTTDGRSIYASDTDSDADLYEHSPFPTREPDLDEFIYKKNSQPIPNKQGRMMQSKQTRTGSYVCNVCNVCNV